MGDTAGVSCLFNIFQHFGSKRRKAKIVGCGYVFFNKKKGVAKEGETERQREEASKRRREERKPRSGSRQKHGRGQNPTWLDQPGEQGFLSILHIYSFSTIDTPGQARQAKGKGSTGWNARAPTKHITVLRSSTFQGGFFLHGEGQSRFNRDDVPRSWEADEEGRRENEVGSRDGVVMRAGDSFIGGKGREQAKKVSV